MSCFLYTSGLYLKVSLFYLINEGLQSVAFTYICKQWKVSSEAENIICTAGFLIMTMTLRYDDKITIQYYFTDCLNCLMVFSVTNHENSAICNTPF